MQTLSDAEIQRLQQDPQNVIYTTQFNQVDRVLPMSEVRTLLGKIRTMYLSLRSEGLDDESCRSRIRQEIEGAETMASNSHPKLFTLVTDSSASDEDLARVGQLIAIRERVESGLSSSEESFAQVLELIKTEDPDSKSNK